MLITGMANSEEALDEVFTAWRQNAKEEAAFHTRREMYMVQSLQTQLQTLSSDARVLWSVGLFHIVGLRRLLRDDPTIAFTPIIEKPIILGFQDGVVLTYRIGEKVPSDEFVARAMLESVVYSAIQTCGVRIRTKSAAYTGDLFAKRIAASFSLHDIRELFRADENMYGRRSAADFMRLILGRMQESQMGRLMLEQFSTITGQMEGRLSRRSKNAA